MGAFQSFLNHLRRHSVVSASDHIGGGGATRFLREDLSWQTVSAPSGVQAWHKQPARQTVGNSTATTYIYSSPAMAGGFLIVGNRMRFQAHGTYKAVMTPNDLTVKLHFGVGTLVTTPTVVALGNMAVAGSVNYTWHTEAWVTVRSNTEQLISWWWIAVQNQTPPTPNILFSEQMTANNAVNENVALNTNYLRLSTAWSVLPTNTPSVTCESAITEIL